MILDEQLLNQLTSSRILDEGLKGYLLTAYGQEPFPHVYSEQDLLEDIRKDLMAYEKGQLDLTDRDPALRWQKERTELQNLDAQKANELDELTLYVEELEQALRSKGLESSRMAKKRMNQSRADDF